MLKELFDIVRGKEPHHELVEGFDSMLRYAVTMAHQSLRLYWERPPSEPALAALVKADVGLNKLERSLRKAIVVDASVYPDHSTAPSLTLMSLVKDVERIGDYAKNLSSLSRLNASWPPDDPITHALRGASNELDAFFSELPNVVSRADVARATTLTLEGRARQQECKGLIPQIAASGHTADVATSLSLGAHYHKRLQGHALNVLSSLIMPLHKLDYFDEEALKKAANGDV